MVNPLSFLIHVKVIISTNSQDFQLSRKILMPLGNQLSFNSGEVDNICKQLQDCQEGHQLLFLHMEKPAL